MCRIVAFCALAVALAGCSHAQLPPSKGYNVQWTVTIPAAAGGWLGCGTGQPACSIVVSTLTVPAGTATCPASSAASVASSPVTSPALPLAPSVSGTQQSAALNKLKLPQLQPTPGAPVMASLKIVGIPVSSW